MVNEEELRAKKMEYEKKKPIFRPIVWHVLARDC